MGLPQYCLSIPKNDDSIHRYILPRTNVFPQCNASSTYFIISDCNNPSFVGDGYCDDDTNNVDCEFDKGDCCGSLILTQYCHFCTCTQYSTPSWTTTANISNFDQSCTNNRHSAYVAMSTKSNRVKINGFLYPNFM